MGFIRTPLTDVIAVASGLLVSEAGANDEIKVATCDVGAVREAILAPKFNDGAPRVAACELKNDGSLTLTHDHGSDGRGLDTGRARKVLEYVRRVWRRPVRLVTVNDRAEPVELAA